MSKMFAPAIVAGMLTASGAFAADARPAPPQRPLTAPPTGTRPELPVRPADVRPTPLPARPTPMTRPTTRPVAPMVRPVGPPPKAK